MDRHVGSFIWNIEKEAANVQKHGVDFETAVRTFKDPKRKIYTDERHGKGEARYFCIGEVEGRILTVRFLYRPRHRATALAVGPVGRACSCGWAGCRPTAWGV